MNLRELLRIAHIEGALNAQVGAIRLILKTEDGEVEITGALLSVDRIILTPAEDVFSVGPE